MIKAMETAEEERMGEEARWGDGTERAESVLVHQVAGQRSERCDDSTVLYLRACACKTAYVHTFMRARKTVCVCGMAT